MEAQEAQQIIRCLRWSIFHGRSQKIKIGKPRNNQNKKERKCCEIV